jgi:parallel beta-helix repeat protein
MLKSSIGLSIGLLLTTSILIIVPLPASSQSGKQIYVDAAKGNNANSGSQQSPLKTIGAATGRLSPGTTVYVNGGTYNESVGIGASGNASAWITFQATPGQNPVINAKGSGFRITGNYIKIIGFNITATENGVEGNNSHHLQIMNNVVHDCGCTGIGGVRTDYMNIENNITYRNSFTSPWQCSGISIYQAVDSDNNSGFHNTLRGNISYANENKVKPNGGGDITDGNGIILDDFRNTQKIISGSKVPYRAATLVENNIVFGNGGRGVHVFESDNITVRNNTSYKNLKTPGLGRGNGEINVARSKNSFIYNNIAYAADPSFIAFNDVYTSGDRWDHNLAFGGIVSVGKNNSNAVFGTSNIVGKDPRFTSPDSGANASNFTLANGSPAIDAGSTPQGAPTDISNKKRPLGAQSDIGAHER